MLKSKTAAAELRCGPEESGVWALVEADSRRDPSRIRPAPPMTPILVLAFVGIAALLAEIVLPGGILGIVGALCLLAAVVVTYLEYGALAGTGALALVVVLGVVCLGLWMRLFHRLPLTRSLVLRESIGGPKTDPERNSLVGRRGVALTDLVPSGRAEIGGEKLDVVAEGAAVVRGEAILVVAERGPSLVVRRADAQAG